MDDEAEPVPEGLYGPKPGDVGVHRKRCSVQQDDSGPRALVQVPGVRSVDIDVTTLH